jgi:hypothetical protein
MEHPVMKKQYLGYLALAILLIATWNPYAQATFFNAIQGQNASGATATANPVQIGGQAFTGTPTPVSDGQAVKGWFDQWGRQVVALGQALDAINDSVSLGADFNQPGLLPYRMTIVGGGSNADTRLVGTVQTAKASEGRLYGIELLNPNADMVYVHFYDASSPTFGTTDPLFTVGVPGGTATNPGPFSRGYFIPITFGTAIKLVADVDENDTTTTGPATGLSGVILYK